MEKYSDHLPVKIEAKKSAGSNHISFEISALPPPGVLFHAVYEFSIHYNTTFGEEIYIVGSIPDLGLWDTKQGKKLHWQSGG